MFFVSNKVGLAVAVVAVLLASSIFFVRSKHGVARPTHTCDLAPNARALGDGHPCTGPDCGGNSPTINAFPINGLNAGCENADREVLEPGSLQRDVSQCDSGSTSPLTLDFQPVANGLPYTGFELVAERGDGTVVCNGSQLAGTTFQVDTTRGMLSFLIAHVGSGSVELGEGPPRLAYQIVSAVDGLTPMCDVRHVQLFGAPRASAVLAGQSSTISPVLDMSENYSIVMPGPVFNHDGSVIPSSVHGWFNIACADDALASSDAIVPTLTVNPAPAELALRGAAVHMLTAKYAQGYSGTLFGTPIAWQTSTGLHSANYGPTQPVEAQWTATGAICVSRSRLYMNNRVVPKLTDPYNIFPNYTTALPESQFIKLFGLPVCSATGTPLITSYVVDHVP